MHFGARSRPPHLPIAEALGIVAAGWRATDHDVMCIQVGANDGVINDPVHRYFRDHGWYGILVEPQTDVVEHHLRQTYAGNDRVRVENAALGAEDGVLPLYRLTVSRARWATGVSSLSRAHVQAQIDSGRVARLAAAEGLAIDPADELIEEVQVPVLTPDTLLARHGVTTFDVLCVDTEGYDLEILRLIDFDRYRPEVVWFEHRALTAEGREAAWDLLRGHGYAPFQDQGDTLGLRTRLPVAVEARLRARGARQALGRRWRRWRPRGGAGSPGRLG